MHVRNVEVVEDGLARSRDFLTANHVPGVVPNPVILSVASDDRGVEVVEPRRHCFALVPVARFRVKKDRPCFCVWMKSIEWPVRQHQLLVSFGNEPKTVAAWIRKSLRDSNQSRLPIRVNTTAPNSFTLVSRDSSNSQLHAFLLVATTALRSAVEHSKQTFSIRFLLSKFSIAVATPPNNAFEGTRARAARAPQRGR